MNANLRKDGVEVAASGESHVTAPGGKCIHGVYIPSNQSDQSFSEYCFGCKNERCLPL